MGLSDSKLAEEVYHATPTPTPPPPPPNPELDTPWRKFEFGQKETLKEKLKTFSPSSPDVKDIKILVAGQIGAGKSSFINSVDSAFQGRICSRALAGSATGGSKSFTRNVAQRIHHQKWEKTFALRLQGHNGLRSSGNGWVTNTVGDIINAVFGHVKEGYKFDMELALTSDDQHYISKPTLSDQAFCLVYVIDASTVQFTDDKLIGKLKIIRQAISAKDGQNPDTGCILMPSANRARYNKAHISYLIIDVTQTMYLGIPQVVVMTKVDEACPLVNKDLRKIYTSKKIKEKIQMCSDKIGVPLSNIFPVKNYHDEIDTEDDIDALILKALEQIVQIADDRLVDTQRR